MKRTLLIFALLLISTSLFSQKFNIPKDYKLEIANDYTTYEKDVISAVNWLLNTPVKQEQVKRKEVNAFLMKWLTGSPTVTIELNGEIVTFMECSECLMVYMGGWAKYALENNYSSDKVLGNLNGIKSAIDLYEKNKKELGKNKAIEKYIKLQNKEKLKSFIEKKCKASSL